MFIKSKITIIRHWEGGRGGFRGTEALGIELQMATIGTSIPWLPSPGGA